METTNGGESDEFPPTKRIVGEQSVYVAPA